MAICVVLTCCVDPKDDPINRQFVLFVNVVVGRVSEHLPMFLSVNVSLGTHLYVRFGVLPS